MAEREQCPVLAVEGGKRETVLPKGPNYLGLSPAFSVLELMALMSSFTSLCLTVQICKLNGPMKTYKIF